MDFEAARGVRAVAGGETAHSVQGRGAEDCCEFATDVAFDVDGDVFSSTDVAKISMAMRKRRTWASSVTRPVLGLRGADCQKFRQSRTWVRKTMFSAVKSLRAAYWRRGSGLMSRARSSAPMEYRWPTEAALISWKSSAVEFLGWLELIFSERDVVDQRVLSVLSKDSGLLCTDVLCSQISKIGKKIVANCMTTIPGASHMGGTNHGFTGLK
jgi:hypothetical protein